MNCLACGNVITDAKRKNRKYCDAHCRISAHRLRNVTKDNNVTSNVSLSIHDMWHRLNNFITVLPTTLMVMEDGTERPLASQLLLLYGLEGVFTYSANADTGRLDLVKKED